MSDVVVNLKAAAAVASSVPRVMCCRNMRGLVITIFLSKAISTACPLVLASKCF